MALPQNLNWLNKHVKTDPQESTNVKHFLELANPSQFRDLVLATRLQGQPLPEEVVPVLNEITQKFSHVNSYVRVWKRLEKSGDMISVNSSACSYCSGTGLVHNQQCWTCKGEGKLNSYQYVGPIV